LELTPVQVGRGYRVADEERSRAWLVKLYGGVLMGMFDELGSWECVGLQLGHEIGEQRKAQRTGYGSK
jgi:hypothetical protein